MLICLYLKQNLKVLKIKMFVGLHIDIYASNIVQINSALFNINNIINMHSKHY